MATDLDGIGGLIIHLERAADRAAHVKHMSKWLPVPSEILPAVDAKDPNSKVWRYEPDLGLDPAYPFPLSDTEVAVFLSHRRAWARIVASGWHAGLILEDDVMLDPDAFPAALRLARDVLGPRRFIRLPMKDREGKGDEVARENGIRAVRPRVVGLNLQASLVDREAAQTLLAATEKFDRPVDTWLQMTWEHDVDILSIWPSGVGEISAVLGGSTQRKRTGFGARLSAEVARARYRRAIARKSISMR
ncbi:MAG: glycosyltransferase family 25 protein [Pseudomonadota bacterium]